MADSIANSPLMITGPGRSGTTWMQWFLSRHPLTHIHGQSPNIPWRGFWAMYTTLVEQGAWARAANARVGYALAHYAGSAPDRARDVFRDAFVRYMTGFGPRRLHWGLKWIGLCGEPGAVAQWESLWPETRWVVCLRHPFSTIASLRNTFEPHADARWLAEQWVEASRFARSHAAGRTFRFQIDRLTALTRTERCEHLQAMVASLGLSWSPALERFVDEWPLVHKDKPDSQRVCRLTDAEKRALLRDVADLEGEMERLGYGVDGV